LVRAFQDAVAPLGGRVVATDSNPRLSAACQVADGLAEVPPIDDATFLGRTLAVAMENEIGLVVPTLDTELAPLAAVREEWLTNGVYVSVPDADVVATCRDKRLSAALFESLGISALREVDDEFPRFVKPVSGSLSADIHIVHEKADLPLRLTGPGYVHQELVDRTIYREYTVDLLYSDHGDLRCAVPRRRIEVRGGEISKGRTERGPLLDHITLRMATLPGARGCLTLQVFHAPGVTQRPVIGIELNGRFGGGYPMSHAAGARFTHLLVDEVMRGRASASCDSWESGATFLRYDEQVRVRD
jgi:carbamoyl-phosphate synthase large subunit